MAEELEEADGLDEVELVPDVPVVLEPAGLVFRMNFDPLEELVVVLVVPDVPVVPGELLDALERSIHPVTVTLSAALELCELGGVVCAATAMPMVHTAAAANARLLFIVSSLIALSLSALLNLQGERHSVPQSREPGDATPALGCSGKTCGLLCR